jgi:tetratricopeptide (TPR) repeat protein
MAGVLLSELGRDDEALAEVNRAVTLSPLEATMHQARGLVNYQAHRFAEAVAAERRALELTPQLPLARTLLVNARSGDSGQRQKSPSPSSMRRRALTPKRSPGSTASPPPATCRPTSPSPLFEELRKQPRWKTLAVQLSPQVDRQ